MQHYKCRIHIDEDRLRSESGQDDPTAGLYQEAGWMEGVSVESVEPAADGYVFCIAVDIGPLMEATTCDSVEAAIAQEFSWLHDSGIYLDTLVPITTTH